MNSSPDRRVERRRARFELRGRLAAVTERARVALCGQAVLRDPERPRQPADPEIRVGTKDDPTLSVAHFARVQLCGHVWLCPVCGPRIRQVRAADLDEACGRWIDRHGVGSLQLLTLTVPHDYGEELPTVMRSVRSAYSALVAGRAWHEDKSRYGLRHYVRAHDVTYGRNGWHPHIHAVLFAQRPLPADNLRYLERRLTDRWARAVTAHGRRRPNSAFGVQLEQARKRQDVANYVFQVVRNTGDDAAYDAPVAAEVARGDLKTANPGQLTPWQILERTGDALEGGYWAARWSEWETTTQGVHAIRWSKGLRAELEMTQAEQSDDEIVAIEVGGQTVYVFAALDWRRVRSAPGALAQLLEAAETGGGAAVAALLPTLTGRHSITGRGAPGRLPAGQQGRKDGTPRPQGLSRPDPQITMELPA